MKYKYQITSLNVCEMWMEETEQWHLIEIWRFS